MRNARSRSALLLALAFAVGLAATPRQAHAYTGSGSGAGFWEALALIAGVGFAAGVTVLTVVDVKAAADKDRVSTELAGAQAGVGGGFAALFVGAIASNDKKAAHPLFVPLLSVFGAFGGYGVGALATDRPQWWLFSGAAGLTTTAAAIGAMSLAGKIHYRATSIGQAIVAAPGLVVGLYGATSPDWKPTERTGGWVLAGASALTMLHGVLDAALKDEPANWNGDATPASPNPAIQIAPQPVSDGRRVVPGFGISGSF